MHDAWFNCMEEILFDCTMYWLYTVVKYFALCCSLITVGSGYNLFSSLVCISLLCILHVLTQVTWGPTPLLTYLIPILYFVFCFFHISYLVFCTSWPRSPGGPLHFWCPLRLAGDGIQRAEQWYPCLLHSATQLGIMEYGRVWYGVNKYSMVRLKCM